MKTYTIIAGVNGVGKSSLTGVLRSELTDLGKIIDVDRIIASEGNDAIRGGKEAIRQIESCLEKGICFTQETTLSGHRIPATVKRAKELDYYIRLYYIGINTADECITRIRNRVSKGGHPIPEADVKRRFAKRFEDLAAVLPYCDEAMLFDNENGFTQVAIYRNGEILQTGNYRPDWLEQLMRLASHINTI